MNNEMNIPEAEMEKGLRAVCENAKLRPDEIDTIITAWKKRRASLDALHASIAANDIEVMP